MLSSNPLKKFFYQSLIVFDCWRSFTVLLNSLDMIMFQQIHTLSVEQFAHSAPSYQSAFRIEGSGSNSLQCNIFEDKRGRLWQKTTSVLANALRNSASLESYSVSHSINKQHSYSLLQSIYMPIYLCLYRFCLYLRFHVKC